MSKIICFYKAYLSRTKLFWRAIPLQLHLYIAQALYQWHKQHPDQPLPLIYGLILYHGRRPYTYSLDIKTLFGGPQSLVKQYLYKPPHLLDLTKIDNEVLKKHAWSGVLLLSLKNIYQKQLLQLLKTIFEPVFQEVMQSDGIETVRDVLEYFICEGDISDTEQFSRYVGQLSTELGEEMSTLAEQWKSEGREEGMEESSHKIAKNLLAQQIPLETVAKATELSIDVLRTIQLDSSKSS